MIFGLIINSLQTGNQVSQMKETYLKSSTPKIPSEMRSNVPEDLCDICGCPETMLNKIFICRGCKVLKTFFFEVIYSRKNNFNLSKLC